MDGKICLITGATSGIGAATALALARLGAITILVGRDRKKCERLINQIKTSTGNTKVDYFLTDLSSQKEIFKLAGEFKKRYQQLDVLINNAGARFDKRQVTVDGYEMTFALNHLAYFLLTNLLLDSLKKSKKDRIINVASSAHGSCSGINFNDLQSEKQYMGKHVYAQSKLANILFTYELARRLEGTGIVVNACHPGIVSTHFTRNNGLIRYLKHMTYHFLKKDLISPEEGARTSIHLATSPEVEGVSGKYFSNCKPIRSSDASYDEEAAKHLWDVSLKLTGLSKS